MSQARPVGGRTGLLEGFFRSAALKTPANFVPHFFAKLLAARVSLVLGNIEPIEDVEIFKDRMTIARHRQDAEEFGNRSARAGNFPSADGVGAAGGRKTTELRHIGSGQRATDRFAQILAELFQFCASHGSLVRAGPGKPLVLKAWGLRRWVWSARVLCRSHGQRATEQCRADDESKRECQTNNECRHFSKRNEILHGLPVRWNELSGVSENAWNYFTTLKRFCRAALGILSVSFQLRDIPRTGVFVPQRWRDEAAKRPNARLRCGDFYAS
jgi:hypothetical protein